MTAAPAVDADLIVPVGSTFKINGDIPVRVVRLRTREWFGLARVLGAGLGSAIMDLDLDWDNPDDLRGQILGMLLLAIPGAEDELIAFLRTLVVPIHDTDTGRLSEAMTNPAPTDVIDLVGIIVDQEGADLADMVGKALQLAPKVSAIAPKKKPTPGPDDRSREPST